MFYVARDGFQARTPNGTLLPRYPAPMPGVQLSIHFCAGDRALKSGRSEAPGGPAQQQREVVGHRASGTTSPTSAVFSSLIHCLGPRGRRRGQTLAIGSENKGAAPRAAPIGPGVSSEPFSQSAAGRCRTTSQSRAPACPACPGTGHGPEPGTQVAPWVAVPVNLSHKVKGIYFSGPLLPSPCAILAGRGGAGTDQLPAAVPVPLRCLGL